MMENLLPRLRIQLVGQRLERNLSLMISRQKILFYMIRCITGRKQKHQMDIL